MSPRWKWFLWRSVLSAVLVSISLYLFTLDWSLGFFLIGLWAIAAVCFVTAIAIWLYSHPDGCSGHEGEPPKGPRTQHEMGRERRRSQQAELNIIGLSGYWVNRRSFGRFNGPGD
ncbi:MAG: hypothetical protein GXY70_04055 [Euryarchaeota archaeon]|nr:hypothetical protein [Euryarchaeota archaeon]